MAPRQVRHARFEILAVTSLGVFGPLVDALDVAAEGGGGVGVEQGIFTLQLGGARYLVEADVVGAALHDGEGRFLRQMRFEGLG